jgi:hypothetical protein
MSATDNLLEFLQPKIGTEIHVGPWLTVDQERIDRFAEVTGDVQWIHTDPVRAKRESPYGATIAHGFLTLSLLPYLEQPSGLLSEELPGYECVGELWPQQSAIPCTGRGQLPNPGEDSTSKRRENRRCRTDYLHLYNRDQEQWKTGVCCRIYRAGILE